MRKLFFIFLLFILTPYIQAQEYIKNTKGDVIIQDIQSQEYVKNTKGDVIIQGSFGDGVKTGSGKLFLYEILGNDSYVLDSISVNKKSFVFKKRKFTTGVYRLTFNNETNALDFVINSSESDKMTIQINNYRIKKGYSILNSIENKIKKSYTKKEESINSKIKLIRKSQKTKDQKILEIRALQDNLFQFGTNLNNQYPGTYFGMIMSHMKSPYNDVKHLYFNDIDFSDESIIRSVLLPTRIQTYMQNFNDIKNNKYGFHDAVDVVMEEAKINDEVAEFCMYNMLDGFYNTGQTSADVIWENLCNYLMDEYIFGEACGDDVEPSTLLKERASQFKNLQLGYIPSDFTASDIYNKSVNLKTICSSNKYTVLMFWASHCNHCMKELPGFAGWYNQNKNSNFEIIAVSLDGNKNTWETTVQDNNFNWINICQFKVYRSPICKDYKIKKTPTFFILNNKMKIVAKPKSTNQLRSFLISNK